MVSAGGAEIRKVWQIMEGGRGPDWFAAQAKPNAARLAARNLTAQGFEVLMPMERYTQRSGSRFIQALRPYFAGYFFVGAAASSSPWRAIKSTHGVAGLVSFGGRPAHVDVKLVEAIKSRCDDGGVVEMRASHQAGDALRVAEGPFAGLVGQFEGMRPDERAWLLLDVMGKATRVSLPLASLRRAS